MFNSSYVRFLADSPYIGSHEQECNTSPGRQDAVCLASSRIYVQNLIQLGNSPPSAVAVLGTSLLTLRCLFAPRLAGVMEGSQQFRC